MDLRLHSSLTQVLTIEDASQVGYGRRTAQKLAEQLGMDATDSGRVALVVTELASNILKHASNGELHLRTLPGPVPGLEVIAIDRGQGFDVQDCMVDGFSTRGTQGIGLGSILRQAQVFDVHSDNRGTVLLTRFYPRSTTVKDLRLGVCQRSLHDDPACGDVWEVAISGRQLSVLVIDGLGHGPEAEEAAKAGALAFNRDAFADSGVLLDDIHREMQGSRGGAVAVAQFDAAQDRVRFTGIGNIGATLIGEDKPRGLASHPGIVGLQYRKVPPAAYAQCAGQLLIMYSDGLQSRWNLRDYPGLMYRHPAVIAAVLHRDYCRDRDDVTVLVTALETLDD
ncbi:ATP-binding protein [Pseudomonas sp. LP_7_YM]|uniref:ATP-binding protein n=1 Tax=Pseudomonas sp. LP_7_YM TaxID=2485137 RepID=UPI0010D0F0C6|nr:ATP-binding protein [Pseudomonas sp. LP_7_YM]TDV72407.1 anti-sigma regulatory factor (Ser/Thr protein kinase) [Pseudomonas sp. LP_7_YM]